MNMATTFIPAPDTNDATISRWVFAQLIAQGGPSMYAVTSTMQGCAYRGSNSRKCAAGWLIPDEQYHPNQEGLTVQTLIDEHGLLGGYNQELLASLQDAHDSASTGHNWPKDLRAAFNRYGLAT